MSAASGVSGARAVESASSPSRSRRDDTPSSEREHRRDVGTQSLVHESTSSGHSGRPDTDSYDRARAPLVLDVRGTPTTPRRHLIDTEPEIVVASRDKDVDGLDQGELSARLNHLERFDSGVTRYEIEVGHEPNPRQSKTSRWVTITGRGTGPTVHAEASGADFRAAVDGAIGKLEEQLRRRRDRRRVRHDRAHRAASDPSRVPTLHLAPDES